MDAFDLGTTMDQGLRQEANRCEPAHDEMLRGVLDSIAGQPWFESSLCCRRRLAERLALLNRMGIGNPAQLRTIVVSWTISDLNRDFRRRIGGP
ncbi:hypothetical protein [Rhizobium sp. SYY.PMSO]|uniref:hypothetical protein n=1 Tax=Rhizobium sp. SYY.PMSO TaxID=3382192 RepID=UPI0013B00DD1